MIVIVFTENFIKISAEKNEKCEQNNVGEAKVSRSLNLRNFSEKKRNSNSSS